MRPCSNVSFNRTKHYPFSSRFFLGSSTSHRHLINVSSASHHWYFFFPGSSSIGSSSSFPILLGASFVRFVCLCLVLHECVCYSVQYILRQAPSCSAPAGHQQGASRRRLLLLHSTAHRLTAAKLGTRRPRDVNGFGNLLGRTSRNACNVMSTCSEKSWLPSNRSS